MQVSIQFDLGTNNLLIKVRLFLKELIILLILQQALIFLSKTEICQQIYKFQRTLTSQPLQ
jgi:hypothetical protein